MLPNVIVIGAMKSGTSSLHYYMSLHPEIFMSDVKELDFFVEEKNWGRGLGWYEAQFEAGTPVRGESSPSYTKFPTFAGVPARIAAVVPDAKLIYVLRDPIERLVSHFVDSYAFGRENGSIGEALRDLGNNHYVNCSRYYLQLSQYFDHFPETAFLVLTSEELKERRAETLKQVFAFVGVAEEYDAPEYDRLVYTARELTRKSRLAYALTHATQRISSSPLRRVIPRGMGAPIRRYAARTGRAIERPDLAPDLRARLVESLRDDVEALRRWSGRPFDEWSL